MESNIKIIFMGTPEFGAIILEEGLIKGGYKPAVCATQPDKPVGRNQILTPPPVKVICQKYNIPVSQPVKIRNAEEEIKNLTPDLIVLAAYGEFLPIEILNIPKYGCLNIHPSLLPKYRGPSPIQTAILNGDKTTGVSVILTEEKMDAGPIVSSVKCQMPNVKITYGELHNELAKLGAKLLIDTIPKWIKGEIKAVRQDESEATYTKILTKEDGKIDWKKSAEQLERQVRAFNPWPGSYFFWEVLKDVRFRVRILEARVYKSPNKKTYPVGKVLVVPPNEIGVQCGKDFLAIKKLQLEGKKESSAEDFLRGHPDFVAAILK